MYKRQVVVGSLRQCAESAEERHAAFFCKLVEVLRRAFSQEWITVASFTQERVDSTFPEKRVDPALAEEWCPRSTLVLVEVVVEQFGVVYTAFGDRLGLRRGRFELVSTRRVGVDVAAAVADEAVSVVR